MHLPQQSISSLLRYLQIIFFAAVIMYAGKILFIPLFLGLLIAIIMYPVCRRLERHGLSKSLSITACLLLVTLLILALFGLLIWQLSVLSKDAPAIIHKLGLLLQQIQEWAMQNLGIVLADIQTNWIERVPLVLESTLQITISTLFILFLIPVYMALILYHRKVLVQYLKLVIADKYEKQLDSILQQTIGTYFHYIKGMVLVYLIVGILNSLGLLALGVDHAIVFGMLCAIMTIIPYIGIIISALLPISVVWLETGNIWYPLGVVAVFVIVQYLEASVIFPKVVGSQLHVSTLAMLISIIAGGIIWGVSGMVLFIPFVAILRIMSDHIDEWKPLRLLLSR